MIPQTWPKGELLLLRLGLLTQLRLPSNHGRLPDGLGAAERLEALVESPLDRVLDGVVKQRRQEGHDCETEADGAPGADRLVLEVLHGPAAVPHHAMDRKGREAHGGETLEDAALQHDGAVILKGGDDTRGGLVLRCEGGGLGAAVLVYQAQQALLARRQLNVGVAHPLIVPVRLVALVADIAEDVSPRDAIGAAHQPGVRYGPERLSNVGGVGDVAVGGEEDCAHARRVGGISDVGLG